MVVSLFALLLTVTIPTSLFVLGTIALVLLAAFLLSGIFGPSPQYEITGASELPSNDSAAFLSLIESMADAKVNRTGTFEVLTNGPCFYPAELEAIRAAKRSVNLEAYIFQKSEIGGLYLDALVERARAGVHVNIVLDAFGSAGARRKYFRPLLDAGGKVGWYNGPRWYRLTRLDNRTHRELLIVDGTIGFIGGAGIADQWFRGAHGNPRWRDTMVRVEGDAVPNLQATFAENWLASCGELLVGDAYFPEISCRTETSALVINSTPTVGGSTRARVLFQLLLASAKRSISITTPYFLPDKSLTRELCRAIEDRGVKVRILVPGRKSDHMVTRSTSRGGYGPLLKAGAEVYEYQPSMIHAKVLCIDELWAVVGSTNFDNRSFGLNDEVNLAVCDPAFAARLERDTQADIQESRRVSLHEWEHRPVTERAPELLGWIFERQQ
jgi:cardiolipin synthase